ncbi:MAG: arylsulfatase [Sedimentisphaerales bacterium]
MIGAFPISAVTAARSARRTSTGSRRDAICVPTRASLLSGLYSQQVGVYGNSPRVMKNCVTLGEVLRAAGYRTLMTGKWHAQEIPVERGFDRYFGLTDGCCNFWNPGPRRPGEPEPGRKKTSYGYPRGWAIDDKVYKPYAPKDPNFYTTDAFTDYAIKYLDEYAGEDKPFFLYVAYTSPHYPLHAWPEDIARYRGKYMIGWDKLREQRYERQTGMGLFEKRWKMSPRDGVVPRWDDVRDKDAWDLNMAVYTAMIDRMDQNIGRILAKIRERGEEDNTLVLFLSDNGGCAEDANYTPNIPPGPVASYRSVGAPWANASNTPFRKFKVWDHEGGISTPLIAYWPSVIKKGGRLTHQMGHLIDIMATFVDVAGADYPSSYNGRDILPAEGQSLLPILQGKQRAAHKPIFWQINKNAGARAVRTDKWKLVKANPKKPWELYDMETDRTELNNLADKYPDKATELSGLYDGWVKRCNLPA